MDAEQKVTPLYDALVELKDKESISFHVPGHKFGELFSKKGKKQFQSILEIDATEIAGLDDLHAADGVIQKAQNLTSQFFKSSQSYFLVGGTTSGNLAAVMAVCRPGDTVLVQRNCHKSIVHGLELAGAKPVFLMPDFEKETGRYSRITGELIDEALRKYPDIRAVFLTYPDYFGRVFDMDSVCVAIHAYDIPVIVDEAHGVHFKLGHPFPRSSLELGCDLVIQSAHKMAPAMTMASYLHVQGDRVNQTHLEYYLQVFQSSSPSYPLMASLDLARSYLASYGQTDKDELVTYISSIRDIWTRASGYWRVLPRSEWDDPLKLTLRVNKNLSGYQVAEVLERQGVYPELATEKQILLTMGLAPSVNLETLSNCLAEVDCQLKKQPINATISVAQLSFPKLQSLDMNYIDMQVKPSESVEWKDAVGRICAESIVPYPPGIPLVLKGERVSREQVVRVKASYDQGARFQNTNVESGIRVF
ncbi:aminotransferase class I/II-fold pyridoxal phosphate-dependent enzyme [Halobacillus amylolyticus]|uniref:Aminotransferase class I/II-fold pyridoxal phosphate-dependent enzyme n=1 Tax=Halobacillus amylolyticus TaxID=2932259 RepID=A0ABY4H9T8_9BACI|nr:aminotransferase class I/II-fold pyridoxal phosphate-dependent enzyme [Halobacillus amylolyticus]UOR10710.1 aminotransferase class I/II-fold pyridoxal phosphate-dependent enzyme [Halobacillus amylolyticus]